MLPIEGANLEAKLWGTGEVVIAIPGLGRDVAYFDMVAPLIASAGYQFVALNPRGIGNSTGSLENLTLDILAQDVANAIQALGVEKAHLLGWAFGNRVARTVAQNHPQQVSSVILMAAGGLVPPSTEVLRALQLSRTEQDIDEPTRIQALRDSLYAPMSDISALLATVQPGTWPEARLAQQTALRGGNVDHWWAGGTAPMLIIQGRHDVLAPAENGIALEKEFPNRAKLVWIEDAAHMMLIEQPAMVAEQIVEYLSG
tara:strand:+ start:3526 stop:4296 length:771 start_codon:yes stop_codon:yes gene_type:complete